MARLALHGVGWSRDGGLSPARGRLLLVNGLRQFTRVPLEAAMFGLGLHALLFNVEGECRFGSRLGVCNDRRAVVSP